MNGSPAQQWHIASLCWQMTSTLLRRSINAALKKVLEAPDVKQRFDAQGFAAQWGTPADFGKFVQSEVDKWAKVVKTSGAKVD